MSSRKDLFKSARWFTQVALLIPILLAVSPGQAPGAFGLGESAPNSFATLAEDVKGAVVNISTTQVIHRRRMDPFFSPDSPFREFFGDEFFKRYFEGMPEYRRKTHSLGSGVVIDSDGLILTNNHVVSKADEIKVKLENGKEYDAKVVGRDPKTDLALIRVKPDKEFPKPARLGDSDSLKVGDWVMAVGNPFGLGHTVTVGIISAKGRVIGAGPYDDFLQTDAAINPGNSGGPLFDMEGRIVGVNTAIVAHGQGIGFAIPIDLAKQLLPQLKSGKVIRGWLGVMIQDITSPEMAKSLDVKEGSGVLVGDVLSDSPAEKANIRRGDVITKYNGKPVDSIQTLTRLVAGTPPNSKAEVEILRDGKTETIPVQIGTMPDEGGEKGAEESQKEENWGLTVQNLTPELSKRFQWDEDERGVIVTQIEPDSPAAEARLRSGDLIKEMNRQVIQNLRDYNQALKKADVDEPLLLLIKRGKNTRYVVLKPADQS